MLFDIDINALNNRYTRDEYAKYEEIYNTDDLYIFEEDKVM